MGHGKGENEVKHAKTIYCLVDALIMLSIILLCIEPVYVAEGGINGYWGVCRYDLERLGYSITSIQFTYTSSIMFVVIVLSIISVLSNRIKDYKSLVESKIAVYNLLLIAVSLLNGSSDLVLRTMEDMKPPETLKTSAGVIHYPSTIILRESGFVLLKILIIIVVSVLVYSLIDFYK